MQIDPAPQRSAKGERTREHILDTALRLFGEQGYEATTMRSIAAAAETSLGLTYRYFTSKEDLVLALYQRLTSEMATLAAELPPGPIAQRFVTMIRLKLELLGPYRELLGALFAAALAPQSRVAVLGDDSAEFRARGLAIYRMVISGASDALREPQAGELATVLYAAYLSLILFWLNDRTPGYHSTHELIAIARTSLGLARPLLGLPPVSRLLKRLARAINPVFGGL